MTKTLLDGPGRVLESVYPRFLVDLAQGDDARLPQAHQQQFRERLMQELLSRVQLQTWTNGGMLNAPLSLRLTLVEKLSRWGCHDSVQRSVWWGQWSRKSSL
ncbi:hypothetical protein SB96558_5279 [Shigella boydii 965-58]|nr:hypothetical protein SB96558_5279 [Shigella boydii 965-58]